MKELLERLVNRPVERRAYNVTAHLKILKHFVLLESRATYRSSHYDPKGIQIILNPDLSDADLGESAWAVLRAARFVPPDHPDWDMFDMPLTPEEEKAYYARLMKRAGVRSRKALYAGSVLVTMRRENGVITLHTAVPVFGGFRGYKGMPQEHLPDTITNEALGRALRDIAAAVLVRNWR
jgi:CDI immunity protein